MGHSPTPSRLSWDTLGTPLYVGMARPIALSDRNGVPELWGSTVGLYATVVAKKEITMSEPSMITITGAGKTATLSAAALADATRQIAHRRGPVYDALHADAEGTEGEQLALPFTLDKQKLGEFLTRWIAIEEEQDRLREEARLLKEEYVDDFPMRAMLVAVKRVRALIKLENHPKEAMKREHLSVLEGLVEQHLLKMQTNIDTLVQDIDARLARGAQAAVNMTTGEVLP